MHNDIFLEGLGELNSQAVLTIGYSENPAIRYFPTFVVLRLATMLWQAVVNTREGKGLH